MHVEEEGDATMCEQASAHALARLKVLVFPKILHFFPFLETGVSVVSRRGKKKGTQAVFGATKKQELSSVTGLFNVR